MRTKTFTVGLLAALLMLLTACAPPLPPLDDPGESPINPPAEATEEPAMPTEPEPSEPTPANPEGVMSSDGDVLLVSDVARSTDPGVAEADLAALVAGNNQFAFDLYNLIRSEPGNLIYSPYSASAALSMVYAGAAGSTEAGMAEALNYGLPQSDVAPAFNALDLLLASREMTTTAPNNPDEELDAVRLNIANSVWGQRGFGFNQPFLETLALNYGAGLRLTDFVEDPEGAREAINQWASEETEGRIENVLPPDVINRDTRMILANAIYMNAMWGSQFEPSLTSDATFRTLNSGDVTVPFMAQQHGYPYAELDGYRAIELPYSGNQISMVIMMPDEGTFPAFEAGLTADTLARTRAALTGETISLRIPRFKMSSSIDLVGPLSELGMGDAFTNDADFSGISAEERLAIDAVLQKAYIDVAEEGTEAAAVTVIAMGVTSVQPQQPIALTLDQPFVFTIIDRETGAILFMGRVVNPE